MSRLTTGTPAPNFTLDDCFGRSITLSRYKGSDNVLLVLNRGLF